MAVINKQIYAPKPTEVSVEQTQTTGTEIGSITINGTETKLYAPTQQGIDAAVTNVDYTSQYTADNGVLIGTLTITTSG